MSERVLTHFIDKMGVELLFVIGLLVIFAYVAVKAFPMIKSFGQEKIDNAHEVEMRRLDMEDAREKRKADEFEKQTELDRKRTEVIGQQNEILNRLSATNEAQTLQMASLSASLEDSKNRSKDLDNVVKDTNSMVKDIHAIVMQDNNRYNKRSDPNAN